MASFSSSSLTLIFFLLIFISTFSSVNSLTCASQKLKTFTNCTDLPSLGAVLHFSYNASNSSLSVAFVATPVKSDGWIAWGINPTATGMIGAQSFIAFKDKGSYIVKTYNLTSYKAITESKLSFENWDLAAEESNGDITIKASLKIPAKQESLNQVWQVGSAVTNGMPEKHDFAAANLAAKNTLAISGAAASGGNSSAGGGNSSAGGNSTGGGSGKNDAVRGLSSSVLGFSVAMFVLLLTCVHHF